MKHYSVGMEEAAGEWRRTHEECRRMLRRVPRSACLRIKYEDLCAEPDSTLAAVFRKLGLDPAGASREFRSGEQHIIGNSMRLRSRSEITPDDKWEKELTTADLRVFERIAGKLNRALGYE